MAELIIAEKPSVARDIAAAIGGFQYDAKRACHVGNHAGNGVYICAARGHLVEQGSADDPGFVLEELPFFPNPFQYRAIKGCEDALNAINKVASLRDVTKIVNACDAGREGELIFRYIMELLEINKPIERMWLQSMTTNGIRAAYNNRRSDAQMRPLADAAFCRSEADWLVGINATRILTKAQKVIPTTDAGGKAVLVSAGRVQTPVLALVVDRENQILGFKSKTFFEVMGTFGVEAGNWNAKLVAMADSEDGKSKAITVVRFDDSATANAVLAELKGRNPDRVSDKCEPVSRRSPNPFDLTTLQRTANAKFNFSAKKTLEIAQSLYEKHKVTSYPRTDSSHLPSDYPAKVKAILTKLPAEYGRFAKEIAENEWVHDKHPVFNDKKISDHFAIIPTGVAPQGLSNDEATIYNLIVRRFMAAFYPAAEFDKTTRDAWIGERQFRTTGTVQRSAGWMAVYDDDDKAKAKPKGKGGDGDDEDAAALPTLKPGVNIKHAQTVAMALREGKTKPPPRYTEATLLGAMETAGKLLEDEEFQDAMKERGLGTPATRAACIEELLSEKKDYLRRMDKKFLQPTTKAMRLIQYLRDVDIGQLASPALTGEWEHRLDLVEQGKLSRQQFMQDIRATVTDMADKLKA